MTPEEKLVRDELTKIYPQLVINSGKVCGMAEDKWAEDLLVTVLEMYLKMDIDKQVKIINDGKLENYLTKMMKQQLVWNSKFFHTYRKKQEKDREFLPTLSYDGIMVENEYLEYGEQDELTEEESAIECMLGIINQYDPFLKEVAKKVLLEGVNIRTVSRTYKINFYHVKGALNAIKQDLRLNCSKCFEGPDLVIEGYFEELAEKKANDKRGKNHKGKKVSEETRQKMSEAKKKYYQEKYGERPPKKKTLVKYSDEYKQQISKTLKEYYQKRRDQGLPASPMKGRKHTEEARRKLSEAHKGMKLSQETKDKIAQTKRLRKLTEEQKEKISKTMKERGHRPPSQLGKKFPNRKKKKPENNNE